MRSAGFVLAHIRRAGMSKAMASHSHKKECQVVSEIVPSCWLVATWETALGASCWAVLREQAYSALLHAAVKCGETDLAVDLYGQMGREGMPRDRSIYVTLIEMFVKLGRVSDALSALADLHTLGDPPDTHLYNLVLVAATKMGPPRFALTVYHRCAAANTIKTQWFSSQPRHLICCRARLTPRPNRACC